MNKNQNFLLDFPTCVKLRYTDKKENQIFLIYYEIQSGAVAKSYMKQGFLIYEEMRKYFPYMRRPNCSIPNFLIYEKKFNFLFYQCRKQIRIQIDIWKWIIGSGSGSAGCRYATHRSQKQSCRIRIRIRIHRIHMFLGLLDPSITKQKSKKNHDSYCFATSFWLFIFENDVHVPSKSR